MLRAESLGVLAAHAQAWRPHIVYLHGGTPGHRGDIETQAVAPLACLQDKQGAQGAGAGWAGERGRQQQAPPRPRHPTTPTPLQASCARGWPATFYRPWPAYSWKPWS